MKFDAPGDVSVRFQETLPAVDALTNRRQQIAQALEIKRLRNVIERAGLDRLDRRLDRRVPGHEDDLAFGV